MTGRNLVLSSLAAIMFCAMAAPATVTAQGLDSRYSFDELQKMAADSQIVVRVRTGAPVEVTAAARGLDYEIPCEVLEVIKGELAAETFLLRLSSTASELNTVRRAVAGKEYVLPLQPIEGAVGSYRLTAKVGFEATSAEARALQQIVSGKVERKVVTELRLSVDPLRTPIEFGKPTRISIRLDNPSSDRAIYEQAPVEIRDGQLYVAGGGFIRITDNSGVEVMPKESFRPGRQAPEPAVPAVINPEGSFRIDIDLAEHFDFPKPGIYGLNVGVTTPNGEVLRSTVPLQLTDGSAPANERPRPGQRPTGELAADLAVPSPEVYVPGQPVNGINMLLRPVKSEYEVGEPIKVELRLTNVDERKQSMNIDIRLERTLMVHVKEQGDSPVVRPFIQRITWNDKPTDGAALPYAMLRPDSFWGKTININSLYGVDTTELLVSSVDPTKLLDSQLNYERLGMTLFSFDKPGVYRVDATYFVQPRPGDLRVWAGKLTSNHVFIRVKPGSAIGQVPR